MTYNMATPYIMKIGGRWNIFVLVIKIGRFVSLKGRDLMEQYMLAVHQPEVSKLAGYGGTRR